MSGSQTQESTAKPLHTMRKQPGQTRSRATVDAIVEGAARILEAQGYGAASTNAIAQEAGVSIGSLYEYFPGKEAIFTELRRRLELAFYEALTADPPDQAALMLRHLIQGRIRFVRENLNIYRLVNTEIPRSATEDAEADVYADYMMRSNAYLASVNSALRVAAPIPFVSEFLVRWVSSTIHDYAIHAPDNLNNPRLETLLIDAVERFLLKDAAGSEPLGSE